MQKQKQLYSGKAKTLYDTDDPGYLIVHYRDDATAFNGVKKAELRSKGAVNNYFNAFIMQHLEQAGIPTHFVKVLSENESLVKRLDMIKVECVVRNWAAGSLCRRLGVKEGLVLQPPIFEFFLKNDELGDPMINEDHIRNFDWATAKEVEQMKTLTFRVNEVLKPLFDDAGMLLVDYKLEFGRLSDGQVVLGDEFTPDGCRIWDKETHKILDKDRFRKDLGNVIEGYQEAAHRLGIALPEEL
ncbi:MAG: phosphoribosylaminoimidazolesuccinocarboxamide synthase [Gammaproteobacteria bacterium]